MSLLSATTVFCVSILTYSNNCTVTVSMVMKELKFFTGIYYKLTIIQSVLCGVGHENCIYAAV